MKILFSLGQVFDHESGETWEVVGVSGRTLTFETSGESLVRMDIEDAASDVADGTLVPQDGPEGDDDE